MIKLLIGLPNLDFNVVLAKLNYLKNNSIVLINMFNYGHSSLNSFRKTKSTSSNYDVKFQKQEEKE